MDSEQDSKRERERGGGEERMKEREQYQASTGGGKEGWLFFKGDKRLRLTM